METDAQPTRSESKGHRLLCRPYLLVALAGIPIFFFINKLFLAFYFGSAIQSYVDFEPQINPGLILVEIMILFYLLWPSKRRWDSLPLDEGQFAPPEDQENVNRRAATKHRYVLGALVVAHAIFGLCFNPIQAGPSLVGYALVGFLFSQPFLLAMWAALAPQRFYQRFLWAFLLCTLISFILELQQLLQGGREIVIIFLDLPIFITITLILLLIRRFSGWQIKRAQLEINDSEYEAYQFGIKHIILLTTITALALGLFRSLLIMYPNLRLPSVAVYVSIAGVFFALLLPNIIIPWYTLAYRRNVPLLVFFTIIFLGAVDISVNYAVINWLSPPVPNREFTEQMLLFQLGSGLSVFVSTLVIRFCGFRLIRRRKRV